MSPGRPHSVHVDLAVRRATLHLLDEVGYPGMSVEAVARRAKVGKAAIYRRWRCKSELVLAHVLQDLDLMPPPDGGSLRVDLTAFSRELVRYTSTPLALKALPGIVADLQTDPLLAESFERGFVARHHLCLNVVLGRAVARGELAARPDVAWAHALMIGPLFAWLFVRRSDPDPELAARLADGLLAALKGGG